MKLNKVFKTAVSVVLALALPFSLAACGKNGETQDKKTEILPMNAGVDMVDGWVSEEVAVDDEIFKDAFVRCMDCYNDTMWMGGKDGNDTCFALGYDTINNTWQKIELDTGELERPRIMSISAADNSLWISADGMNSIMFGMLIHVDLTTGQQSICEIKAQGEQSTEAMGSVELAPVVALNDESAFFTTGTKANIVNKDGQVTAEFPMEAGTFSVNRIDNVPYLWTQEGKRPVKYEGGTLSLGEPLKIDVNGKSMFSSNNGNILFSENGALNKNDLASDRQEEMFKWMDVALSYSNMSPMTDMGFENSEGKFFYIPQEFIDGLVKVEPGKVPVKDKLVMAVFGDAGNEEFSWNNNKYSVSNELMDAVIRFNNTDPQYRIAFKPIVYENDSLRENVLMELATGTGVDLIDTSILPERAANKAMLADLLPYIDSDKDMSREDFIPALFNSQLRDGGLYEYTNRFSIITLITRADFFTDRENWTAENILALFNENPDLIPLLCNDTDYIRDFFVLASTGEFIDWENHTCNFENPAFASWLELLKNIPASTEMTNESGVILSLCEDLASAAGLHARYQVQGDYAVAGFPETEGTGSYFVPLSNCHRSGYGGTRGLNTRVGIMASSEHKDAGWRFIKTLILNDDPGDISNGIPMRKESFEKCLNASINDVKDPDFNTPYFGSEDAENLKSQVYGTEKICHRDETLLDTITTEVDAFLNGKGSPEECAAQIQSRVSIYLEEQK